MQAEACERDVKRLSWFATCDRKKASSQSEGFARFSASSSSAGVALIVLSQFSPTSSRFIFKFMPNISIGVKKNGYPLQRRRQDQEAPADRYTD